MAFGVQGGFDTSTSVGGLPGGTGFGGVELGEVSNTGGYASRVDDDKDNAIGEVDSAKIPGWVCGWCRDVAQTHNDELWVTMCHTIGKYSWNEARRCLMFEGASPESKDRYCRCKVCQNKDPDCRGW